MIRNGSVSKKQGSRDMPSMWKSTDKIRNNKTLKDNSRYTSEV